MPLCFRQVEVAVIMQTVSVLHDTRTSAAALAAALNAAALDASLQVHAPRHRPGSMPFIRLWAPSLCRQCSRHMVAGLNDVVDVLWLQPPRKQVKSKSAWIPPAHLLVAAALLLVSCLHYLAKPTGAHRSTGPSHAALPA
jgi:hypothetical protein